MKSALRLGTKYKEFLIYGITMALVLLLLKVLEAHFIVFNYRLDFFIGAIAVVFTVLGVWLALKLVKPKVVTQIVEKEVFIENQEKSEIDQKLIAELGISKRELDVLSLMAQGFSNDEIAGKLFISLNTVKTQSSNMFVKLDVKRRTQAVEKAKRMKIIL